MPLKALIHMHSGWGRRPQEMAGLRRKVGDRTRENLLRHLPPSPGPYGYFTQLSCPHLQAKLFRHSCTHHSNPRAPSWWDRSLGVAKSMGSNPDGQTLIRLSATSSVHDSAKTLGLTSMSFSVTWGEWPQWGAMSFQWLSMRNTQDRVQNL